jgi:hypothetical protein
MEGGESLSSHRRIQKDLPSLAALSVVVAFLSALLLYTWAYSLSNPEARRNAVAAKFVALWG